MKVKESPNGLLRPACLGKVMQAMTMKGFWPVSLFLLLGLVQGAAAATSSDDRKSKQICLFSEASMQGALVTQLSLRLLVWSHYSRPNSNS
jgi:hypothetical protein